MADLAGEANVHAKRALKALLEGTMEAWRDAWICVEWHERVAKRGGYRNGYYLRRRWPTPLGVLCNVRVPRCRERGLTVQLFDCLERHGSVMCRAATEALFPGVTSAQLTQALADVIDRPASRDVIRALSRQLEVEAAAFRNRVGFRNARRLVEAAGAGLVITHDQRDPRADIRLNPDAPVG